MLLLAHDRVEIDLEGGAHDRDFLEVPFADRGLEAALGADHAVGRTVQLTGIEFALHLFVVLGEDLQFAHRFIGGVALAGIADRETIVACGRKLEFGADREVAELVAVIRVPALALLADDGAVDGFVVVDRSGPAGEVLAVEVRLEAFGSLRGEELIGLGAAALADRDVTPANRGAVGLEANRTLGGEGGLAVVAKNRFLLGFRSPRAVSLRDALREWVFAKPFCA